MFRPIQVIDPHQASSKKKMSEENQNIQVFVRCRPLNAHEKRGHVEVITEKKAIKINQQNKAYSFDNVFDTKAKQFQVYQSVVEPLVDQVIEGYNCTVFAYGQTGTGKTFTMVGNRTDKQVSWEEDPASGIIPRAIDQLIDDLENQDAEYTIRVSFLELYNEDAYDLLSPLSDANKLRIYNDTERKGSVIISGLVEMIVKTKNEIFDILEKGSLKRQTAPTLMNACSSRSHSIFSVTVHIKEVTLDGEEVVKLGKLNLVDLAGSENIGRSGAVEERAREASNINKSLLTLGRVITSLVEKSPHIPYRDSKLTRLLQDSLGGKTKTSIIATISPSLEDLEDTISTLDYAQRAKKITNKPEINLKMSKKTLITEYLAEINRLQRDLEASRDKKGVYVDSKNFASMETRIKEQEQSLEVKEARIEFLQEELNKCSIILSETEESLKSRSQELERTKSNLNQVSTQLCVTEENLENVKVEVTEHKVLVEAHQKAEQKLLNEAKSVLQIADKCTGDNQHLFKKIDSFSLLENTNSLVLKQFLDSFNHEITQINNFNLCIFNSINKGNDSIAKLAENNRSKFLQRESELRANLNHMQNNFDQFKNDLLELVGQEKDAFTLTNNLKSTLNNFQSQMATYIQEGLSAFSNNESQTASKLDDLVSESLKARTEIEEMIMMQISKINDTSKHTILTVQSIKDDLMENYKDKCLENDRLRKEISELRDIIANIKVEEQLKQLTTSINQITMEYQLKLSQIGQSLNNVDTIANSFSDNDSKFTNQLSMKAEDCIQYCKNDVKDVSQALSQFDECNNQNCKNLIDKCNEIKKVRSQFEIERESLDNNALCQIDNSMVSIDENIANIDNQIKQSMKIKSDCLDNFTDKVATFANSNNEIVVALCSGINDSTKATLDEYNTMQSDCETFNSSQQIRINECRKIAENLCSKGYQTYNVTGETPKKCSYTYPRNFTITSPHERIISRFRANIGMKSTLGNESIENSNSLNGDCDYPVDENEENKVSSICNDTFSVVQSKLDFAPSNQITKNNNRKFLREKN